VLLEYFQDSAGLNIMANPQPDEFTRISNELLDQLCTIRIPGEAMQILLVIFRKTYGYNKKEDKISLSRFSELTNLATSNCSRAIKKLERMNLISVNRDQYISIYSIQKDYDKWQILSKTIVPQDTIQNDREDTITLESDTIQKDSKTTIQNDRYKRKKENKQKKRKKEEIKNFPSLKIKELFSKHSKIKYPQQTIHIQPILDILKYHPPDLSTNDIWDCILSNFSKLQKNRGINMEFLTANIRNAVSVKHEEVLTEKKKKELKQAEIERKQSALGRINQHNSNAEKYRLENAEIIIKYSKFFKENPKLFSVMEKHEINKAFQNNTIGLVENISLRKIPPRQFKLLNAMVFMF